MRSVPVIYPAPPLTGHGTISREELNRRAIEEHEPDALFARGNTLLREGNVRDAVESYLEAVKKLENCAELRANLGIALHEAERDDEALLQLRRAILTAPELLLAHHAIAQIQKRRGERSALVQTCHKILSLKPDDELALTMLGEAALAGENWKEARDWFEKLIKFSPTNTLGETALAKLDFQEGLQKYSTNDLESGFRFWGRSYRRFPRVFSSVPEIVREFRDLLGRYSKEKRLESDLEELRAEYRKNPDNDVPLYKFVARYLFSIGLYPEAWEEYADLETEFQRWARSLEEQGEHPYPHFRFALIHLYRGKVEPAFQELTICQDRFLPKKQRAIKLQELFELARLLRDLQTEKDSFINMNRPLDEWERAGFSNPFRAQPWRESGLSPSIAYRWEQSGFSAKEATRWARAGLEPEIAKEWRDATFSDPQEIYTFVRGGFSPTEARQWKEECGLSVEEMIQSRKAGFNEPRLAFAWSKVIQFPWEANRWHELGFTPEETQTWIENGFREPHQAAKWKKQGFDAAEALRQFNALQTDGTTPSDS